MQLGKTAEYSGVKIIVNAVHFPIQVASPLAVAVLSMSAGPKCGYLQALPFGDVESPMVVSCWLMVLGFMRRLSLLPEGSLHLDVLREEE